MMGNLSIFENSDYAAYEMPPSFDSADPRIVCIICKTHKYRIDVPYDELIFSRATPSIRSIRDENCPECIKARHRENFSRHPLDPAYENA